MTQFDLFDYGKMPSDIPFSVDILSVDLAGVGEMLNKNDLPPLKDENMIIKSFPHRATIQKDLIISENEVVYDISRDLETISAYSYPDYYCFLSNYRLYEHIMTEKEENRIKESVKTAQNQVKSAHSVPRNMVRHIVITNVRLCELIRRWEESCKKTWGMIPSRTISYTQNNEQRAEVITCSLNNYKKMKEESTMINTFINTHSDTCNEFCVGQSGGTNIGTNKCPSEKQ
jgi:hypothetical protein